MTRALLLAGILLAWPLAAQAQLAIGSRVQTTDITAVRDVPGGTSLGLQPIGMQGSIVAGPTTGVWGFTWWQVNYDAGVDGWSTADRLVLVQPLPGAFSAPTITRRDVTSWTLKWGDLSTNEATFEIERGLSPTGPFAFLASVPANSVTYEDRAAAPGTRYCYQVRAVNAVKPSAYTPVACSP